VPRLRNHVLALRHDDPGGGQSNARLYCLRETSDREVSALDGNGVSVVSPRRPIKGMRPAHRCDLCDDGRAVPVHLGWLEEVEDQHDGGWVDVRWQEQRELRRSPDRLVLVHQAPALLCVYEPQHARYAAALRSDLCGRGFSDDDLALLPGAVLILTEPARATSGSRDLYHFVYRATAKLCELSRAAAARVLAHFPEYAEHTSDTAAAPMSPDPSTALVRENTNA
jgi:hypothetical protein